ncbi:MAG: oxygen-dependent coproporphyrinogen oxidase [Alphaproteobacteria bacterium]|nr:oxygen-dependent coproporphyrinogen oxidase [Alphaproteobacteria bacterium]
MSIKMNIEDKKKRATKWFKDIRNQICDEFESIEPNGASFERTLWDREDSDSPNASGSILKGGGEISVMRGGIFEKIGVNISTVYGTFSEEFRAKIPGAEESNGDFWASGVSLVAHMKNPFVPAVHMNTRMISTSKCWFGGGADLTPTFEFDEDTKGFHKNLKDCCDRHDPEYHPKFKKWCDEYFFLPHRNEPRGIGGIFYDYLDTDWEKNFNFTQDVGKTFNTTFSEIVRRRMETEWNEENKDKQLIKRGRYAEFNLLYDRGTQFGLKTGGNTDAILMSMPPEAKWI